MRQIRVLVLSTVYSSYASAYDAPAPKKQKPQSVVITCISHTAKQIRLYI